MPQVSDEKRADILQRRLQNDSKCGGRSKSRIMSKAPRRWGKATWLQPPVASLIFPENMQNWYIFLYTCTMSINFQFCIHVCFQLSRYLKFHLKTGWAPTYTDLTELDLTDPRALMKTRTGQDIQKTISIAETCRPVQYCNVLSLMLKQITQYKL